MHVALLTSSYPRSPGDPAGHFVAAEARALARAGHRVTVFAPGSGESMSGLDVVWIPDGDAFGWPGALPRLRARPSRSLGVVSFLLGARRALQARGPFDRVVAHWLVPCGWPLAASAQAPIEVVAHGSDVRLLLTLPSPVRGRILRSLLDRGASFRFVSHELRAALAGSDERLLERSRVEPPALDLEGAPDRKSARAELAIEANRTLVVLASRLVASKRLDVALSAVTLLPNARVVVIGDGPERRALAERFPHVELLGRKPRSETLSWLAAADLVVSASREEGAPSVVREARALGVPVVTANVGDVARWARLDRELYLVS